MPALSYLYQILSTFRHLFSRHLPWILFCLIILGFIGTHHLDAITSLCRFWNTDALGSFRSHNQRRQTVRYPACRVITRQGTYHNREVGDADAVCTWILQFVKAFPMIPAL